MVIVSDGRIVKWHGIILLRNDGEKQHEETEMHKNEIGVDYLELLAKAAEEDRAKRGEEVVLPEPQGEKTVDYIAVSKQWKEARGLTVNENEE